MLNWNEEIQRIHKGSEARGWTRFDALLLRAADEYGPAEVVLVR
jgi:hypothetical protein